MKTMPCGECVNCEMGHPERCSRPTTIREVVHVYQDGPIFRLTRVTEGQAEHNPMMLLGSEESLRLIAKRVNDSNGFSKEEVREIVASAINAGAKLGG